MWEGEGMPVTRSEAIFFAGGLAAGVAAVAAYPWLKRHLEPLMDQSKAGTGESGSEMGRKLAETVDQFLQNAPHVAEAGASGVAAGVSAARRMAEAVKKAATDIPVTAPTNSTQAA